MRPSNQPTSRKAAYKLTTTHNSPATNLGSNNASATSSRNGSTALCVNTMANHTNSGTSSTLAASAIGIFTSNTNNNNINRNRLAHQQQLPPATATLQTHSNDSATNCKFFI